MRRFFIFLLFVLSTFSASAQIGEHRNDLSIGFNAGYVLSNISFTPKVTQSMHSGFSGGFTFRYVCEKYFNSICAIQAELNYSMIGWKEKILDANDVAVLNDKGEAMAYARDLNYIQLPILARLGWGKEEKGFQFFFQAGPQFGFYINDKEKTNFTNAYAKEHITERSNQTIAQDTMSVANKLDYGITAGLGVEYSIPHAGHILFEGRYYYGLGDIYGNSKRDYFSRSNLGNIILKMTYLFDITKTKK